MITLAKWIMHQYTERAKKRRWIRFLDLIIVFIIFQITLLLMLLSHPSSLQVEQSGASDSNAFAIAQIPTTSNQVQQQTQSNATNDSCTDPQQIEGSCLEGVFDDEGGDYKNQGANNNNNVDNNGGPRVLNPISDSTALFFYTPYKYTIDNPQILLLWGAILAVVDIFIVLMFAIYGIRMIISGIAFRFSKIVEELPNVLLAFIVVHTSLLFITALLGLNNILVGATYTKASNDLFQKNNGIPNSEGNQPYVVDIVIGVGANPLTGTFGKAPVYDNLPDSAKKLCKRDHSPGTFHKIRVNGTYKCKNLPIDVFIRSRLMQHDLNFTSFFDNLQDLGSALNLLLKIMALMLMAQMIIRLFFINLYIITAPIGIGCWALPGKIGQSVTGLWLKGFISTVFIQFVMVIALVVLQVMAAAILHFVATTATPATNGEGMTLGPGKLDMITLTNLMCICFLWFLIRLPALFGTAPMRTMLQAGQAMAQVVNTTVGIQMAEAQMVLQGASTALSFMR